LLAPILLPRLALALEPALVLEVAPVALDLVLALAAGHESSEEPGAYRKAT